MAEKWSPVFDRKYQDAFMRPSKDGAWISREDHESDLAAANKRADEAEKKLAQRNAVNEAAVAVADAADSVSTFLRLMLNTPAKNRERFDDYAKALEDARGKLASRLDAYRALKEAGDA